MNLAMGAQGFRPLPLAAARVVDRNPDGQQAQPLLVGQSCHQSRGLGLGHSYYIHTTCFMPEVTSGRHSVLATQHICDTYKLYYNIDVDSHLQLSEGSRVEENQICLNSN